MKPAFVGIGAALLGAAAAAALIYTVPALQPDADEGERQAAPPASVEDGVVTIDRSGLAHAAIRIVSVAPAHVTAQRHGFARALDIGALSAIESEIESARAAFAASQADYARQQALAADDQSAATRAVEAARAQALADRARVTAAERRVGLEFGPGLANTSPAMLHELIRAIAAGEASLVRVDFTDGPATTGARVRITDRGEAADATLLGAAAATDPKLQTAGSLAIVRGPLARLLGAGRVLPVAMLAVSGSEDGALVPRDAILRFQGGLWVYRLLPKGGFARAELIGARPEASGWFARSGARPGERIAAGGVGVLLSLERGGTPAAADGDD